MRGGWELEIAWIKNLFQEKICYRLEKPMVNKSIFIGTERGGTNRTILGTYASAVW